MVFDARGKVREVGETAAAGARGSSSIPLVLVAVGLGWLVASSTSASREATARRIARPARTRARRAEERIERSFDERPLALGAIALAVGAAVGLLLPRTDVEDRWLGDKKERFFGRAREKAEDAAREAISSVHATASELAHAHDPQAGDRTEASPRGRGGSNGLSRHA